MCGRGVARWRRCGGVTGDAVLCAPGPDVCQASDTSAERRGPLGFGRGDSGGAVERRKRKKAVWACVRARVRVHVLGSARARVRECPGERPMVGLSLEDDPSGCPKGDHHWPFATSFCKSAPTYLSGWPGAVVQYHPVDTARVLLDTGRRSWALPMNRCAACFFFLQSDVVISEINLRKSILMWVGGWVRGMWVGGLGGGD